MRSEKMRKIRIICLEKDKGSVVAALHRLSIIDLRKSALQLPDGLPAVSAAALSESLIRLNGAMQRLLPSHVESERHLSGNALGRKISSSSKVISEVYSLSDEARRIGELQERLNYAEESAAAFSGSSVRFGDFDSEMVEYRAFISSTKMVREFENRISEAKMEKEITTCSQKKRTSAIFIAYAKDAENSKKVEDLVKELKLKEVDLRAEYLEGLPSEILKKTKAAKAANAKRLNEISSRLFEISRKHYSGLANLREMLEIELSRAEIGSNFKKTEETCIIEGWVPAKRLAQAKASISSASSGRYELEEINSDELAPTYLNRPKILKPFDFLMNFYSTPRSDEPEQYCYYYQRGDVGEPVKSPEAGYQVLVETHAKVLVAQDTEEYCRYGSQLPYLRGIVHQPFRVCPARHPGYEYERHEAVAHVAYHEPVEDRE